MAELVEVYDSITIASKLLWQGKIQEAIQTVDPFVEKYICAELVKAEALVWKNSLHEPSDESHNEALNYYLQLERKVINIYNENKGSMFSAITSFFSSTPKISQEEQLRKDETLIETASVLADISGGIAMLHLRKQNRMEGAYRLRKAWKYFQEANELLTQHKEWNKLLPKINIDINPADSHLVWEALYQNPESSGEYSGEELRVRNITGRLIFGKGLFIYTVSMLPKSLQWIVELIGFTSNRDEGLKDLLIASKIFPSPRAYWSRVALGTIRFFFFDEADQCMQLVQHLMNDLPDSPLLYSTIAGMYRNIGQIQNSIEAYQRAADLATELKQSRLQAKYELGNNYYLQNKWEEASVYIREYLEQSPGKEFKAFGGYKLGVCLWMLDPVENLAEIKTIYGKVINEWFRPTMSYDAYAVHHCRAFLEKNSFSKYEILVVQISNLIDGFAFDTAVPILHDLKASVRESKNINEIGMYHYLKGHLLHKRSEPDKAIKRFSKLVKIASEITVEKWIVVYAEIESVEIFIKKQNYVRGQIILDDVKKRSGYDFEKHVGMRIKKLQHKLNEAPKNK